MVVTKVLETRTHSRSSINRGQAVRNVTSAHHTAVSAVTTHGPPLTVPRVVPYHKLTGNLTFRTARPLKVQRLLVIGKAVL